MKRGLTINIAPSTVVEAWRANAIHRTDLTDGAMCTFTLYQPRRRTMTIKLGSKVRDIISGFTGVATGRAEYISGCAQVLIGPVVGKDGSFRDGQWFDEQRLVVDPKAKQIVLDNTVTPGPDKAAPKR